MKTILFLISVLTLFPSFLFSQKARSIQFIHNHFGHYQIELYGEPIQGSYLMKAQKLLVMSLKSQKLIQEIDLEPYDFQTHKTRPYISTRDLNFDGFQDIVIAYKDVKGSHRRKYYKCWLTNPETGELKYSSLFENLAITSVNSFSKEIEVKDYLPQKKTHLQQVYKYDGNKLILIREQRKIMSKNRQNYTLLYFKRINNKLVQTIKKEQRKIHEGIVQVYFVEDYKISLDLYGKYGHYSIEKITITDKDGKKQVFKGNYNDFNVKSEERNPSTLIIQDINFDGKLDFRIRLSSNRYDCWLYNTETNVCQKIEGFHELENVSIDYKNKRIISKKVTLYAHMQSKTVTYTYTWQGMKLVEVGREVYRSHSNPNKKYR